MRIFTTAPEMMNEMSRDLYEMGVPRITKTMQDKDISVDPDFVTTELTNVSFSITRPMEALDDIFLLPNQDEKMRSWCEAELSERINPRWLNPGDAWQIRSDVWDEFRTRNKGKFSYTYNERIRIQLPNIITRLREDRGSRQCILSIWNPTIDVHKLGIDRVPCSLYYHYMSNVYGDLDVIYAMRSCDFVTHMPNDVWLAIKLWAYVCKEADISMGRFFMNISSLHYYMKDEHIIASFMKDYKHNG